MCGCLFIMKIVAFREYFNKKKFVLSVQIIFKHNKLFAKHLSIRMSQNNSKRFHCSDKVMVVLSDFAEVVKIYQKRNMNSQTSLNESI